MLTEGCRRDGCSNANCRSNPQTAALTAPEAAIQSIHFATEDPVPLCVELEQQQEETLPQIETQQVESPAEERAVASEQPQAEEVSQVEASEERHSSKEELQPETSEAEVSKTQQPDGIVTIQPMAAAPAADRKSTPRRRLSIAVQLDSGLNKTLEIAKRPTVITRVVVQPKHKAVIDPAASLSDDVTTTAAEPKPADMPTHQQQEQEQAASTVPNPVKDVHQRRLSRPKERLFDAIKRSFSRSKKAPLGSA
jgi:hypothetical protein